MKYSNANKPLVCMQTQSTCYKGTRKMTVKGVLWHSTGVNNPNLKRYVQPSNNDPNRNELLNLLGKNISGNDWNHTTKQAGLNCWIGKLANGTVATVQTMPWNYRPWGCGSGKKGSCNNGWIQFEICEDNLTDPNYFTKIYNEACEITAYLCKLYKIDPHDTVNYNGIKVPTILCHSDSHRLGLGSGHADVMHWFPKFGKSMATARDDVAKLLNGAQIITTSKPNNETNVNYQVVVTTSSGLNCRETNSVSSPIVKIYPYGTVLTITKENNNWGFTGQGWISLTYTSKVIEPTIPFENQEDDDEMTKEQVIKIVEDYLSSLAKQPATWEQGALSWAQANGLFIGDEQGNLMGKKLVTRGELATVLQRFAEKNGK